MWELNRQSHQANALFLLFASEMQAFRAIADFSPTVDPQAIDLYLHFQYVPAPHTIYREIQKLPPAHCLQVSGDGTVVGPTRYWDRHSP